MQGKTHFIMFAYLQAKMAKVQENSLALVEKNADLAKMYRENAAVGSQNLGGSSPLLKVYKVGKSAAILKDGTKPNDGWFFYKPTGEQFETVDCHILTISRGFRADGINKKNVWNQIMAGVIVDENIFKPFIMYLTGSKLKNMWEFGKTASKYTKQKPTGIPMFAMTVRLTTESITSEKGYGDNWIIGFEILRDKEGYPFLVNDINAFQILKHEVEKAEETIESLISARATDDDEPLTKRPTIINNERVEPPHPADDPTGAGDIPF